MLIEDANILAFTVLEANGRNIIPFKSTYNSLVLCIMRNW